MSAKLGYNIRTFANNNFLKSLQDPSIVEWTLSVNYSIGDFVFWLDNKYIASSTGTSGISPPIHLSGEVSDGGVNWIFVEKMPGNNSFYGNLYSFIGKRSTEWTSPQPPTPEVSDKESTEIINNIITLKSISPSDIRFGIKNNTWTNGKIYNQYDPNKDPYSSNGDSAYTDHFFCITDNEFIFKCIDNNYDTPSTIKPTTTVLTPGDGYVWKYMGSVKSSDINDFTTSDYSPITFDALDILSEQYDIRAAAKNGEISTFKILGSIGDPIPVGSTVVGTIYGDNIAKTNKTVNAATLSIKRNSGTGAITQVLVQNPGADYFQNCVTILRDVTALGSGAYTFASNSLSNNKVLIENGSITSITLDSPGSDYQAAKVLIIGNGDETVQATATATILGGQITQVNVQQQGSGYTYARAFIVPCKLNSTSGGTVAESVLAPKNGHGYNIIKELGANALIFNIKTTNTILENDYYLFGEDIGDFRQLGIIIDVKEEDDVTFANNNFYIGPDHTLYNDDNTTLNKISPYYGEILYSSNFNKITRESAKSENTRVTIIF